MAKLPSGTRKRKDGTLEKRFTLNGKRYSVYGVSVKELTEKEQETREQIKAGLYTENRNITLNNYFDKWIVQKAQHVKSNSIYNYTTCYNTHLRGVIGSKRIINIERRELTELQYNMAKETKPQTINHVFTVLKILLNDAVADEIISKNPANHIKALKCNQVATETKHRALTTKEQNDFMQELKKDSYYYSFIAFMLCTGMRCGEVSALTWADIDLKENLIHVTKTITKNKNGTSVIGDTAKSGAGVRDIPITETVRNILQEHKKNSSLLPFKTNLVFCGVKGGFVINSIVNGEIKRILKKLADAGNQIEPFTSHAMRDTFATRFIEQGGNMHTLQKILGHSSITMTMDIYAHVLPDTKQNEMDRIKICV